MRACDRMARRSTYFPGKSTMTQRSDPYPNTCITLLLAHCLWCKIQHQCFDVRHALGCTCTTLHDTISHPFHTAKSCFVLPVGCVLLAFVAHLKRHALTRLFTNSYMAFAWAALSSFPFIYLRFFFLFPDLLFPPHLAGRCFGQFWFCEFSLVVPYFANFWIFSIFENLSIWAHVEGWEANQGL